MAARAGREPRRWGPARREAAVLSWRGRHAGKPREAGGRTASCTGRWERKTAWRRERQSVGWNWRKTVRTGGEGWHGRHPSTAGRGELARWWELSWGRIWHARERRRHASREAERWGRESIARLVLGQHGIGMSLALGSVGGCDGVYDRLRLLVADLLVVVDDIAQMVSAAVVRLADAHGVVREVHITVIACRETVVSILLSGRKREREKRRPGESSGSFLVTERMDGRTKKLGHRNG
jgi:hypothetical protein